MAMLSHFSINITGRGWSSHRVGMPILLSSLALLSLLLVRTYRIKTIISSPRPYSRAIYPVTHIQNVQFSHQKVRGPRTANEEMIVLIRYRYWAWKTWRKTNTRQCGRHPPLGCSESSSEKRARCNSVRPPKHQLNARLRIDVEATY